MGQLPLALQLGLRATFASFAGERNRAAKDHVRAVACGRRAESVWLAGPANTGKTHLLAAACRAADEAGRRPMYLPLDPAGDPGMLEALVAVDLVALDGLDLVAGHAAWEAALFAAVDARLASGGLLMAARRLPRECGFGLPDLVSRAGAAAVYRLSALDDEELLQAITGQAALRGLALDGAAASYLLQRVSRDIGDLTRWLDRIDRFALAAQRQITIPLLRRVLEAEASDSA